MKKIKLAITGCMGRMGHQLIKSVKIDKNFKLVSLTENKAKANQHGHIRRKKPIGFSNLINCNKLDIFSGKIL